MLARTCTHVRQDGTTCGSIALRRKSFCQYHQKAIERDRRRAALREHLAITDQPHIELPHIEDRASAMMALNEIMQALAVGLIDRHTARILFQGVHVCLSTLKTGSIFREDQRDGEVDESLCEALLRRYDETMPPPQDSLLPNNDSRPDHPLLGTPAPDINASIEYIPTLPSALTPLPSIQHNLTPMFSNASSHQLNNHSRFNNLHFHKKTKIPSLHHKRGTRLH